VNADPMDALEQFAPMRYVALTEAEAAELGTGCHNEWRLASPNGVHVDAMDYVEVLQDGARWRRLCSVAAATLLVLGTIVTSLGLIYLLGLWADWVS
jgi:hypothetical protein